MKTKALERVRMAWICGAAVALQAIASSPPPMFIADFVSTNAAVEWRIVNDDVMGGVSISRFEIREDGIACFLGRLSLENNGGFASVRSVGPIPDLTGHDALLVRVKGDGRLYQLRVRAGENGQAWDYEAEFKTETGKWQESILSLADFVPTWRGRILSDLPPINPAQIQSIGFLLADKQAGAFELEIDWIKAGTKPAETQRP